MKEELDNFRHVLLLSSNVCLKAPTPEDSQGWLDMHLRVIWIARCSTCHSVIKDDGGVEDVQDANDTDARGAFQTKQTTRRQSRK